MRNPTPIVRDLLGSEALHVADVGAARGIPAHLRVLENSAQWYLFEPHPESAEALERAHGAGSGGRVRVIRSALSSRGGTRTLYVTNAPTGSSLLRPGSEYGIAYSTPEYFFPCREIPVETQSLAAALDAAGIARLDFIKLDIQGAELEALSGIDVPRLERLLGVETEIGLLGAYHEQPGYGAVARFLQDAGLELFDLKPVRTHRPHKGDYEHHARRLNAAAESPTITQRIWEVDAVFFRRPGPLLERKDGGALRRLIVLYCAYGFFGEALALADRSADVRAFDAAEAEAVVRAVVAWHGQLASHAYYRPGPYALIRRLQATARRALRLTFGRTLPRWRDS
jgi:FkbM family methyltransferase